MYMGRGHAGPDLETYLPKEKILWMSETFESRQVPSMGDSSYPAEWIALMKEAAVDEECGQLPGGARLHG